MSTLAVETKKYWIQNPRFDLTYFTFGWIIVFLAFMSLPNYSNALIIIVLLFNFVHRHLTMALVYGQKEEFVKRKMSYILMPVAFAVITVISILAGVFKLLLAISVAWTMYHVIAQKYGFTRIYSRKAGYGKAWIDKGIIYSWVVYLIFALAEKNRGVLEQYQAGQTILNAVGEYLPILTLVSYAALAVAVYFTVVYAYEEFKNRDKISLPKNLFVLSILFLYAILFYDLIVGYVVFGFSHAIEYIAFVNIFVHSKYTKRAENTSLFSKVSRKQWIYSGGFSLFLAGVCYLGIKFDENALAIYITGSSFLHFIYDGWIWKLRKPEVSKPLDIGYTQSPTSS
ncbi:MAG: hypothetical protein CL946_06985 [Ectothiorhodospiraceae bacterium]|nr:hypothetical protein [Ectothiorhodospiraceae bacterium]